MHYNKTKSWIKLHLQFGKFQLFEVFNYSNCIAISCKHSETQYVLVYLFFIDDFASLEN
jgi:hypothetical protein